MIPESPTVTNNPVVVELYVLLVLDELLDELQDMAMKLKRNMEKMMSICLTWFPLSSLGEPNIYNHLGYFTRKWGVVVEDIFGKYLKLLSQRKYDRY